MDLKKLQDLLIKHEGIRFMPYRDTVGKITIGVGHNLTDKGLTKSQIMSLLVDDMTDTINYLNRLDWFRELDDVRQLAIADLTFNIGSKVLGFNHMLEALRFKDWDGAARALMNSTYATQVGHRALDLASMIRTGKEL
jgi:lysozyme